MWKTSLLIIALFVAAVAPARDKPENWIEVSTPHFVVATNANEKQARRVADQFERMRSVFHLLFPKLQMDPGAPIIVLAIRDEKDFRALEPEAYLAKGQLKLGGLFLRAADKNYVLMRLDAGGEHPYEVVYHEYTHLLLGKAAEWMPLWLNEGLAQFYENTDINEKDVSLGQGSLGSYQLLRERPMMPLRTLFAVDTTSPYYHEENKGDIFYAQSWALTHMILLKDYKDKTHRLTDYSELLRDKVDPVEAAQRSFGDLKQLEAALANYIRSGSFSFFKMNTSTSVDESSFKAEALTTVQADALRADFLAYNERGKDARALLDQVLKEDPKNVSAHETMGFLEFRQGHFDEAKKWYAQAVQLDSQSYLAHYYFAAMSMTESMNSADEALVEASLRRAIKLNPSFAPAFDRLAVFLGSRRRDLDEAHMLGLTAVGLEPGDVAYRVNVANVLLQMDRPKNAVEVLRFASKLAKTPQESQWVDSSLMHAQEFEAEQGQRAQVQRDMNDAETTATETVSSGGSPSPPVPRLVHRDFVPSGPHRFVVGVIKAVRCDSSSIDLAVESAGKSRPFHSDNYFTLPFSALGFQPSGEINPCKDIEGRPAKIEYVESANHAETARLVSVELHK